MVDGKRTRFVYVGRRMSLPATALVALVVILGLIATIVLLDHINETRTTVCTFKRITSVPCATCGSTRALLRLVRGDILGALRYNPAVMVGLFMLLGWAVMRFGFGYALQLSKRGTKVAWILLCLVILANWAYVIGNGF